MSCRRMQLSLEQGRSTPELQQHLESCSRCQRYQQMQQWSRQVLLQGEVEAVAPRIDAIWASIHRAAEQNWETALNRSFHRLLPYLVTIAVLMLVVAGLRPTTAPAVPSSRGAAILLNASDAVTGTQVSDLTAQAPGEMLGLPGH